jgi:hypothetical protein
MQRRQFLFEPDIACENDSGVSIEISNRGRVQLSPALFGYFLVLLKSNRPSHIVVSAKAK